MQKVSAFKMPNYKDNDLFTALQRDIHQNNLNFDSISSLIKEKTVDEQPKFKSVKNEKIEKGSAKIENNKLSERKNAQINIVVGLTEREGNKKSKAKLENDE